MASHQCTSPDNSLEGSAGPFSTVTFSWVYSFLSKAEKDIKQSSFSLASLSSLPEGDANIDSIINCLAREINSDLQPRRRTPSLSAALVRSWKHVFFQQAAMALVTGILFTAQPVLLQQVVLSMKGQREYYQGGLAILAMAILGLVGGLLQQQCFHIWSRFGRHAWVALVGNIFDKLAKIDARQKFSEGQIVSMIGQDASLIPFMSTFFATFLLMPLNIIFPSIILSYFLREAFAAGLAVCILIAFLSDRAAKSYKQKVVAKLRAADTRLMIINEALQGIRSVKLCAWELAIEARVASAREAELRLLLRIHLIYALQQGIVASLPILGLSTTFLVHAGLGRTLDADIIALTIGYFDVLAIGFLLLPNVILQLKVITAGLTRIGTLLYEPDTYSPRDTQLYGKKPGIFISDATLSWQGQSSDSPQDDKTVDKETQRSALRHLTFSVNAGQLVTVVGPVASGKSTCAAAVFGLAQVVQGSLDLRGKAAFVPQNPQILNASVRRNILFGTDYDERRYLETLAACCLKEDIAQFAEGDETEIGEKGITISGGQRARVALARAYYADADVIVLDDPLSAMDAHVGRNVFQKCIMNLRKQGKAILMMTNQLQFCGSSDFVVVLQDGEMVESGQYADLTSRPYGHFSCLLQSVTKSSNEEDSDHESLCNADDPSEKASVQKVDVTDVNVKLQPETKGGKKGMSEEVTLEGRMNIRSWLSIARSGQSWALSVVLLIICILVPIFMYLSNMMLGIWSSASARAGGALNAQKELAIYITAGLLFAFLCWGRVTVAALYFVRISRHLHQRMLSSVLRQPIIWFDTTPLGRILNRFSQDVGLVDLQLPRVFEFSAQHSSFMLATTFGALSFAWPAILLIVPMAFLAARIQHRISAVALDLQRLMLGSTSPVMSQTSGFLTTLDTIRAFGREGLFAGDFRNAMSDFACSYYWMHAIDRLGMSLLTVICVPLLTLLLGMAVLPLARSDVISAQLGGLVLALSSGLAQRIPLAFWCFNTVEKFFGAAQRIAEYADLPWEGNKTDHDAWLQPVVITRMESVHEEAAGKAVAAAVQFEDIFLRYQPGLPLILKGLSLSIRQGEKIGVCGRTGSGKSTLFLSCFRMIEPDAGRILIYGSDARSMPLSVLRSRLAIVPQDALMFSGTVRSNLDFHGRHTDDELWAALSLARLETQLRTLPGGLDEAVTEKGSNFSSGTVQLLCIARILLERQQIVFLDECTASVDYNTDSAVQEAIRSVFKDCAVISIAHRLLTIIDCDRIACLDQGKVAECGSAYDLLQNPDSIFTKLVASTGADAATELKRRAAVARNRVR